MGAEGRSRAGADRPPFSEEALEDGEEGETRSPQEAGLPAEAAAAVVRPGVRGRRRAAKGESP